MSFGVLDLRTPGKVGFCTMTGQLGSGLRKCVALWGGKEWD